MADRPRLGRAVSAIAALLVLWAFTPRAQAASERPGYAPARSWSRLAAESWLGRAEALSRRGETASAITAYTEAVRADPTLGRAYLGLAQIRSLQGDYREAEWLLTRAGMISDLRADAFSRRAELYTTLGRGPEALNDLSRAAELDPSRARLEKLAAAYVQRRAWVAALAVWRRIRVSLPSNAAEQEVRDAEETVRALSVLAGEADGVQHDTGEHDWVRRSLRHQVQR